MRKDKRAARELLALNQEAAADPTKWHKKPNTGGPCAICGCPAKRLKARHRADPEGGWSKSFVVCFGTDFTVEKFGGPGWPER